MARPRRSSKKLKKGKVKKVQQEREEPQLSEPEEEEKPSLSKGQKRRAAAARAKKRAEEERIAAEKKAREEAKRAKAAAAAAASAAPEDGNTSKSRKKKNKKKKKQQEEAARAAAAAQAAAAAAAAQVPAPRAVPEPEPEPEFQEDNEGDWEDAVSNRDAKLNARYAERQHAKAVGPQELKVEFPASQISALIGTNGSTLEAIEDATNVKIDVPDKDKRGKSPNAILTLCGLRGDLPKAEKAIQEVADNGFSSIVHPDRVTRELVVTQRERGGLIGPNFKNITEIEKVTNTKIKVPQRGTDDEVVKVVGNPEDCRRALSIMKELIEVGFSPVTHPTWVKATVDFPTRMLHRLIGRQGANLKAMESASKTKITVPRQKVGIEDLVMTAVGILGDNEDVMKCRTLIDEVLVQAMAEEAEDKPVAKKEWGGDPDDDLLAQFEW